MEQERLIEIARNSNHIKAVLLDIDCPGGSVGGSEVLYARLERLADVKPIVAFVRGLGASGGYFIGCSAQKIVTLPSALIGSIGVLYVRPGIQDLLNKLGIHFSVYKGGRFKDMTGFWRDPTEEEEGKLKGIVEEIHNSFISSVAKARGIDVDKVRELATGEVFTGRKALELGLVDEIGDFERALQLAAELGKTQARPLWIRPKRRLFDRLTDRLGRNMAEGFAAVLQDRLEGKFYYRMP